MMYGLQGALAAASVGLGCGTCCGSGISAFLFGYLTTHTKGMKQAAHGFAVFYLGKIAAVTLICLGSSLLGRRILDETGTVFGFDVHFFFTLAALGAGIVLTGRWIYEKTHKGCGSCRHCHAPDPAGNMRGSGTAAAVPGKVLLAGMGIGYGASPCAPLIFVAGLAVSMPAGTAAASGVVFALSSAFAPALMLLLLSGVLSGRLRREIPQYLDLLRLVTYLVLVGAACAELF